MNILIVTNHFWPEDFRINDLASGLNDRGHNISVLTGIAHFNMKIGIGVKSCANLHSHRLI